MLGQCSIQSSSSFDISSKIVLQCFEALDALSNGNVVTLLESNMGIAGHSGIPGKETAYDLTLVII